MTDKESLGLKKKEKNRGRVGKNDQEPKKVQKIKKKDRRSQTSLCGRRAHLLRWSIPPWLDEEQFDLINCHRCGVEAVGPCWRPPWSGSKTC